MKIIWQVGPGRMHQVLEDLEELVARLQTGFEVNDFFLRRPSRAMKLRSDRIINQNLQHRLYITRHMLEVWFLIYAA